ncbi:serine hydrolase domain-containing protein [Flavobacterium tegetincola]|uniref:serine hydrolase domain-containing protein n=1 Tax=Flavobacterium tegetincola TaxID=150172 RepID=UPI0004152846|nr:serine hydrolase [Flavobacterium tegetincola]
MKKIVKVVSVLILIGILYAGYTNYPKLELISGFSAKSVASAHFIDHRSLELIEKSDNDIKLIRLANNSILDAEKSATSSVFGLQKRKAIYREGLGSMLIDEDFDVTKPYLVPNRVQPKINFPYPFGTNEPKDSTFSTVDYSKLQKAVDNAFDEGDAFEKRTRSVVILHKDHLLIEKYADGFSKDSRILGWSMTKSITATYFGILQYQNKFDINKPAPIAEWKADERAKITTHNLIQMNSGLEWEEKYDRICDATKMLFQAKDMGQVQLDKPLFGKPNASWNYSSGTSNLLSKIVRNQFKTHQEYLDFWYWSLIDKIGMYSMVVETDMTGNYVGSSYAWATTRDWAKFGLLYLHNGNWLGEQLFDASWSKYVATPTPTSDGKYGGHFWLNSSGKYPDAPRDMYYASGFQGQKVIVIPSKDLVIVRMGLTDDESFDFNGFLKGVLGSFEK